MWSEVELEVSRELAQECLDLANQDGMAPVSVMGHFIMRQLQFSPRPDGSSKKHLDQALAAFSGGSHPAVALFAGPDIGAFCRSYQSQVLWQLGNAGEAAGQERRRRSPPPARFRIRSVMAIALDYAAMLHVFHGEIERARARARKRRLPSAANTVSHTTLSVAEILAELGNGDGRRWGARRGAAPAVAGRHSRRRERKYAFLLPRPARGSLRPAVGKWAKPWRISPMGLRSRAKNGEVWSAADLHRIHGDLLLRDGKLHSGASQLPAIA